MNRAAIASPNLSEFSLGSTVTDEGVVFRVWAPNASEVSLCGDFNDWQTEAHPMQAAEGGIFEIFVPDLGQGAHYKYCLKTEQGEILRADPRGRKMTNSVGDTITWQPKIDPEEQAFEPPNMNEAIIYEMHLGSFHVPDADTVGNFDSAIEKLDYLKDLGINVIELMPIAEFAGDLSWGYNPAYPFCIEGAYGGPEGLLKFVKEAHARGIAVIVDVVYNHFGPSDLGIWQFDGWSENGLGGIYFYNDWRAKTPWGDCRPDYGRGEVRSFIRDNALMWFDEYGVDGLRWDMTLFIRTCCGNESEGDRISDGWTLMQWVNNEIRQKYSKAITISEDLRDDEWLVKDTGVGGAGFSAQWDASFVHPVRDIVITPEDADRDLGLATLAVCNKYDGDAFKRVVYSESHDEVANGKARLPTEIQPDDAMSYYAKKRSLLAAALVMTSPGVPMLFQGQEFLEDEWFRDSVPLDWSKAESCSGVLQLYRDLIALRLNKSGFSAGLTGQNVEVIYDNAEHKLLGIRRWREGKQGDDVIALFNFSGDTYESLEVAVPTEGEWRLRLNSDSKIYAEVFDDQESSPSKFAEVNEAGVRLIRDVSISPYGFVIYSQDPMDS